MTGFPSMLAGCSSRVWRVFWAFGGFGSTGVVAAFQRCPKNLPTARLIGISRSGGGVWLPWGVTGALGG